MLAVLKKTSNEKIRNPKRLQLYPLRPILASHKQAHLLVVQSLLSLKCSSVIPHANIRIMLTHEQNKQVRLRDLCGKFLWGLAVEDGFGHRA